MGKIIRLGISLLGFLIIQIPELEATSKNSDNNKNGENGKIGTTDALLKPPNQFNESNPGYDNNFERFYQQSHLGFIPNNFYPAGQPPWASTPYPQYGQNNYNNFNHGGHGQSPFNQHHHHLGQFQNYPSPHPHNHLHNHPPHAHGKDYYPQHPFSGLNGGGGGGLENYNNLKPPFLGQTSPSPLPGQFPGQFSPPTNYFPGQFDGFYGNPNPNQQNYQQNPPFAFPPGGFGDAYGLPKQVRVPDIQMGINFVGRDAEITCSFPRYLILIQAIYWHHKSIDPYGSFYDSSNGFGPKVTVSNVSPWKSILLIRDYGNEDDTGIYRCISTAILPDANNPGLRDYPKTRTQTPNNRIFADESKLTNNYKDSKLTNNFEDEKNEVKKSFRTSKAKYSEFRQNSKKIRFSRSTKLLFGEKDKKFFPSSSTTSSIFNKNKYSNNPNTSESILSSSSKIYDPFLKNRSKLINTENKIEEESQGRTFYHAQNNNPYFYNNNNQQYNFHQFDSHNHHHKQTRYFPHQHQHQHQQHHQQQPQFNNYYEYNNPNIPNIEPPFSPGLNAPYYKPSYSVFTVYSDIYAGPRAHHINSSPIPSPNGK